MTISMKIPNYDENSDFISCSMAMKIPNYYENSDENSDENSHFIECCIAFCIAYRKKILEKKNFYKEIINGNTKLRR